MTSPLITKQQPSSVESPKIKDVEQKIVKNETQVKHSVEFLNGIKSNSTIKWIVEKIVAKIDEFQLSDEIDIDTNTVKVKIKIESDEQDNIYNIKFIDVQTKQVKSNNVQQNQESNVLNTIKNVRLCVHKKNVNGKTEYKFAVKLSKGAEEFIISENNEKLPYKSQVSALEKGFDKNLVLIATATGSGKTITKLMFAITARLRGMKVISVNPRADLVKQEYNEQKGAVSSLSGINYDGYYKEGYRHNVIALETLLNNLGEILDFGEFSRLLKNEGIEEKEFKVDLKNERITIGKNVKIYKDYYTIGNKKYEKSIFSNRNLLLMLDEVQDMVDKGEAYYNTTQLLLLLAHWKKINLVITTATPPAWMNSYIQKEKDEGRAHIESQSLQQKIESGIGGRIDVEVCHNLENSEFVNKYVEYHNQALLKRLENEQYYYNHKEDESSTIEQKVRKYIMWNVQSVRNRMTLACMDSTNAQNKLKECLWRNKKSSEIGAFLKESKLHDSTNEVKKELLGQFGKENTQVINEVLEGFEYKGSIVDSGTFAVLHGVINNVIACIIHDERDKGTLEDRLSDLNNQRFLNIESFREKVKGTIASLDNQAAYYKINKHVQDLDIGDYRNREYVECTMRAVWRVLKGSNEERLNELLDNHNLSREIHRMMPPDLGSMFSNFSDYYILDILKRSSNAFFTYLKRHYEVDGALEKIEQECSKQYEEYSKVKRDAKKYQRETLEPAQAKFDAAKKACKHCEKRIEWLTANSRKGELKEAQEELVKLKREEENEGKAKCSCEYAYGIKTKIVSVQKEKLTREFRKIITEFKNNEKYPLRELRGNCEELSVYDNVKGKDICDGDKLSKVGFVGYYFNWERKSGYDNKMLHSVLMRETMENNIEDKKQCVGRGGRKKGPIVSSSYVDSAKIKYPKQVKDQLLTGDPFSSIKEVKRKIDEKKYAEKMVEGIKKLVDDNYPEKFIDKEAYNTLIRGVFQHVLQLRQEIYNCSGYSDGRNEANKHFYQVLKIVTSKLKKQLDQKGIVVGDCDIAIGIRIIESKIGDLLDEHKISSFNITHKQEKKDEISDKLKIEGNFLKVIIVKFCTMVLRLWYWRFTLDMPQLKEVLKKENKLTFKERIGLIREENKITKEATALQKVQNKQESQIEGLKKKRTGLQEQYNKMHKYIGVKEIKSDIKQKEITSKEKEKIIKEQLGYIESELKEVQSHMHKNNKDVDVFYELNNQKADIANLEVTMCSLREGLERIIHKHGQLDEIKKAAVKRREDVMGTLSENQMQLWKESVELIVESLRNGNIINDQDKNYIINQIKGLKSNSQEDKQLAKEIVQGLLDHMNKASWIGKTPVGTRGTKKGGTKLEELCNTISHQTGGLDNRDLVTKGLKFNCGDAKGLLKSFDEFAKEKIRLEEVTKEQAEWQKKAEKLEGEKKILLTYEKQMDICRRLKIFKNINEHYDVRSIMWLGIVLSEFLPKLHESKENYTLMMKYISSPVFFELFTNIIAPFVNEGNLKIALDIFDPNSSKNGADNICEFYQSLLNKDLNNIKKNINNVSTNIAQLCILIVLTKLNHHANAFGKDLELINSLTFGFINPTYLAQIFVNEEIGSSSKQQSSVASSEDDNKVSNILQGIGKKLFSNNKTAEDLFNNIVKAHNPISTEIRGNHFNTGTTVFSTLNIVMRGLAVVADMKANSLEDNINDAQDSTISTIFKFLGDSSIRKAKEEIAKLSDENISREVTVKSIYECLDAFRAGLNGRDYHTSQQYDFPVTLLNACRVQNLSRDYKEYQTRHFPASLIAASGAERLDVVQANVALVR